jgi:hypothetical protein
MLFIQSSDRNRPSWLSSSARSWLSASGSRYARAGDARRCGRAHGYAPWPRGCAHGHRGYEIRPRDGVHAHVCLYCGSTLLFPPFLTRIFLNIGLNSTSVNGTAPQGPWRKKLLDRTL